VDRVLTLQREAEFQRPSRLLAGLALSFALHGALLLAWRQGRPDQRPDQPAPTSIAVWWRPMPPKTEPVPATTTSAAKSAAGARAQRRAKKDSGCKW
jgi:hypothetical protein